MSMFKIVEKERLANLLRKEMQLTYLQRVVDNDAMNRANRLLVDNEDITVFNRLKKDDDYWTSLFTDYEKVFIYDDSDINYD